MGLSARRVTGIPKSFDKEAKEFVESFLTDHLSRLDRCTKARLLIRWAKYFIAVEVAEEVRKLIREASTNTLAEKQLLARKVNARLRDEEVYFVQPNTGEACVLVALTDEYEGRIALETIKTRKRSYTTKNIYQLINIDIRSFDRNAQQVHRTSSSPPCMLLKILTLARRGLQQEMCPRLPRSVLTKAEDLLRNLPRWQLHVKESAWEMPSDDRAYLAYEAVINAAQKTISRLKALVEAQVTDAQEAEDQLNFLSKEVRAAIALIRYKEEFKRDG